MCLLSSVALATHVVPAGASPIRYVPPVSPLDAVVVDHFRPPPTPYAAGNRGLDYATVPGSVVVASADGAVTFAGAVGGALYVTLRHPDGLRTTSSYLARIVVAVGRSVRQGQPVGFTGTFFHFGVRDALGDYLDPEALFAQRLGAHLLPDEPRLGRAQSIDQAGWSPADGPDLSGGRRAPAAASPLPVHASAAPRDVGPSAAEPPIAGRRSGDPAPALVDRWWRLAVHEVRLVAPSRGDRLAAPAGDP
jgi:murein DD-endopeptidase MepM/ murein hydrolase activator NlpD